MGTMTLDGECVEAGMANASTNAGPRVIVVDDVAAVRGLMRRILENGGYDVIGEAEDGDEAVLLSDRLVPDLVVMDYYMDGMNGVEATIRIKNGNPFAKVVIVTGAPEPSLVSECFKAGAVNFVIKPIQTRQLLNVAKNATGYIAR